MKQKSRNRTFSKVFRDKTKLVKMLHMRRCGWTFKGLAVVFGVDYSSIYKACKIHGVVPLTRLIPFDLSNVFILTGFTPRREKSYREIIEEAHQRRLAQRFPKLYEKDHHL